jgi:hypothetical protein
MGPQPIDRICSALIMGVVLHNKEQAADFAAYLVSWFQIYFAFKFLPGKKT